VIYYNEYLLALYRKNMKRERSPLVCCVIEEENWGEECGSGLFGRREVHVGQAMASVALRGPLVSGKGL
jgi:hypothetical protein